MDLGEKLREARKKKGLTQDEVVAHLGLRERSTVAHWESGRQGPSKPYLARLAILYGVPIEYLLGTDEPLPQSFLQLIRSTEKMVDLPILGTIRGGEPMFAEENIVGYMAVDKKTIADGEYYCLIVTGDSMAPGIAAGDHVLVKMGNTCDDGQIAVVLLNDNEATLKRVHWQGDVAVLYSDNPAYKPMHVKAQDIRICGCVKSSTRNYM